MDGPCEPHPPYGSDAIFVPCMLIQQNIINRLCCGLHIHEGWLIAAALFDYARLTIVREVEVSHMHINENP